MGNAANKEASMDQGSSNANTAPNSSEATENNHFNMSSAFPTSYNEETLDQGSFNNPAAKRKASMDEGSFKANQETFDAKNQAFDEQESFNTIIINDVSLDEGSFNASPAAKIKASKKQKPLNANHADNNEASDSFNAHPDADHQA